MENKEQWVLVADDDPILREVAASSLREGGFHVDVAENGTIAIKKLRENLYDLALVDLNMPGADGFEVIHNLRNHGADPHLPAIVITGRDDLASIEKAYSVGATSFLAKPINWSLLHKHVKYIMRTSQVSKELRQAKADAEIASNSKSQMFSVLTHELKSPLHTVIGFSDMILKEKEQVQKVEEYARYISESAASMNIALSDMIYYFRAIAGELDLNCKSINIVEIVNSVIAKYQADCRNKGCLLEAQFSDLSEENIYCDKDMILRSLSNLVSNAIKFSNESGRVVVSVIADANGTPYFIVEDNGCGMSPQEVQNCSIPLQQSDMSHTRKVEGLGMGLAVTKKLVEAHGGNLYIESEPQRGTRACFTMPLERLISLDQTSSLG